MKKNFKAITLSFKSAHIALREMAALNETAVYSLLGKIKELIPVSDVLIISTCNRTELFYYSEENHDLALIKLIALQNGISNIEALTDGFERIHDHDAAVDHLFRVSTGLEAQVVGDIQIANQIKRAYQASADCEMAGPFLHRLMHTIFYANKRVVQETSFRDGAASVSYAATELVRSFAKDIIDPKILVLGVGEIGEDVAKNLKDNTPGQVTVVNRTAEKANDIATECNFQTLPFEQVWDAIADADIIISSISRSTPFIAKADLAKLEIFNFKYFIDLSVPRSIDLNVEDLPGAILYNVDNIQTKADEALEKRLAAIPAVEGIISEVTAEFNDWAKEMMVTPTIQKLKSALEDIRMGEMTRYMKELNQEQAEAVDKITKSMMNKILKMPVVQLKAACKRGDAESVIGLINELFNLEESKIENTSK